MIMITKLIMLGIAVVFVAYKVISKFSKKRNRVKFYVARDKNGIIYLYIGKPERAYSRFLAHFGACIYLEKEHDFKKFGLKSDDFKDLKWEDEPVEVFVNMEE